ncbi:MAG: hypothetical protein ACYDEQ_01080 [Desulfocucumaceae bacterium]
MEEEKRDGYELELNEETENQLREYARSIGRTEDDVFEFIITQYLQRQLTVIEKRSRETGIPFNNLINMQFVQLLEFLKQQGNAQN